MNFFGPFGGLKFRHLQITKDLTVPQKKNFFHGGDQIINLIFI